MERFIVASDAALEQPCAGTGGFHIVWFGRSPFEETRESFVVELAMVMYGLAVRAASF